MKMAQKMASHISSRNNVVDSGLALEIDTTACREC
ncbi:hypothetical protein ACJJIQ_05260 [Microbulbifer sp. ANSA003]